MALGLEYPEAEGSAVAVATQLRLAGSELRWPKCDKEALELLNVPYGMGRLYLYHEARQFKNSLGPNYEKLALPELTDLLDKKWTEFIRAKTNLTAEDRLIFAQEVAERFKDIFPELYSVLILRHPEVRVLADFVAEGNPAEAGWFSNLAGELSNVLWDRLKYYVLSPEKVNSEQLLDDLRKIISEVRSPYFIFAQQQENHPSLRLALESKARELLGPESATDEAKVEKKLLELGEKNSLEFYHVLLGRAVSELLANQEIQITGEEWVEIRKKSWDSLTEEGKKECDKETWQKLVDKRYFDYLSKEEKTFLGIEARRQLVEQIFALLKLDLQRHNQEFGDRRRAYAPSVEERELASTKSRDAVVWGINGYDEEIEKEFTAMMGGSWNYAAYRKFHIEELEKGISPTSYDTLMERRKQFQEKYAAELQQKGPAALAALLEDLVVKGRIDPIAADYLFDRIAPPTAEFASQADTVLRRLADELELKQRDLKEKTEAAEKIGRRQLPQPKDYQIEALRAKTPACQKAEELIRQIGFSDDALRNDFNLYRAAVLGAYKQMLHERIQSLGQDADKEQRSDAALGRLKGYYEMVSVQLLDLKETVRAKHSALLGELESKPNDEKIQSQINACNKMYDLIKLELSENNT